MPLTGLLIFGLFAISWVASLFHPVFGIAAYLLVYFIYDPTVWWADMINFGVLSPSYISMLFLLVGCALHHKKLNFRIARGEFYLFLFLALAWLVTMASNAGFDRISLIYLGKISRLFIFIFLFNRAVTSFSQLKFIIWICIAGGLFLTYQAHVASEGMFAAGRLDDVGGVDFSEANSLAGLLSIVVAFLAYKLLSAGWWRRILYVPAIAVLLNTIVMTRSRAIFLGMIIAAPFMAVMVPTGYKKKVLIFICLGAILLFLLSDYNFLIRMRSIGDQAQFITSDSSPAQLSRVDYWKAAMQMIADHPFGVGIKHYQGLVSTYDPRIGRMDAHNTYVLCCAETGLLGFFLFMLIIAESFRSCRRAFRSTVDDSEKSEVEIVGCSLFAALLIFAAGLMTTHSILYTGMLWILLSFPFVYERAVDNMTKDKETEAQAVFVPSSAPV
jgi:O-antigen ligase